MEIWLCARNWSLFCLAGEKRKCDLSVSNLYRSSSTQTRLVTNAHWRFGYEQLSGSVHSSFPSLQKKKKNDSVSTDLIPTHQTHMKGRKTKRIL